MAHIARLGLIKRYLNEVTAGDAVSNEFLNQALMNRFQKQLKLGEFNDRVLCFTYRHIFDIGFAAGWKHSREFITSLQVRAAYRKNFNKQI